MTHRAPGTRRAMNHRRRSPSPWLALGLFAAAGVTGFANADGPPPKPAPDRDAYARPALEARGDAVRGRAVFADAGLAGCANCHRVRGEGGDVGPDLSDVGGKLGREHLVEAVLEPSRQIVEGYRPTTVALADGRVLTGLVKSETDDALVLV